MDKHAKELTILQKFIGTYCREQHRSERDSLCEDCRDLLAYAERRLERCPLEPKPSCKKCPIHCYRPEYRAKIRAVMKFSGIYYVKRGRLDYLFKL